MLPVRAGRSASRRAPGALRSAPKRGRAVLVRSRVSSRSRRGGRSPRAPVSAGRAAAPYGRRAPSSRGARGARSPSKRRGARSPPVRSPFARRGGRSVLSRSPSARRGSRSLSRRRGARSPPVRSPSARRGGRSLRSRSPSKRLGARSPSARRGGRSLRSRLPSNERAGRSPSARRGATLPGPSRRGGRSPLTRRSFRSPPPDRSRVDAPSGRAGRGPVDGRPPVPGPRLPPAGPAPAKERFAAPPEDAPSRRAPAPASSLLRLLPGIDVGLGPAGLGLLRAAVLPERTGARSALAGRGCLAVSLTRMKSHTAIARSSSVST